MDVVKLIQEGLGRLPARVAAPLESVLRRVPGVTERIQQETAGMLDAIEPSLKPYRNVFPTHAILPAEGMAPDAILAELEQMRERETPRWEDGFASGAVYQGDPEHIDFLNRVYALHSQSNPLHVDLWPSATKMEAEILAMTGRMLHAEPAYGTVTSGGTESIFLSMKAHRDWARETKGIRRPEVVLPTTAHAAFDKAAECLGMRLIKVPVDADCRADVGGMRASLSARTVLMVGSAPSFPHGAIDPIPALSQLARERGVGFHTDACLGGFLLPWARKLGYPVPDFDFSLPGVTAISCDTHKYGYAAKGTSVLLYRTEALRRYQFFAAADWPGGLYFSPTLAGSRPGALVAACWAALLKTGEQGYLDATKRILETSARIKASIRAIPELQLLGDPLFVLAFTSDQVDVYRVMDFLSHRKWALNGLHKPPALHLCVTLRHTREGVAERFVRDLKDAVEHVRGHPPARDGMAPAYAMAATFPLRGVVADLLKGYLDRIYRL